MEPDAPSETAGIGRWRTHAWLGLILGAVGLAALVLRTWPPETAAFYPRCPIREWSGLLCPGCGGTRALAALAGGQLGQALRSNPLVVTSMAACAAYVARGYARALRGRSPVSPTVPMPAILAAGTCALIFTLVRNLA